MQDQPNRRRLTAALTEAKLTLEQRVEERTRELTDAHARLQEEIERHKETAATLLLINRVVEKAQHAIVISDEENRILYVNQAYERLTGFSAGEAMGKPPSISKSGRHGPEFYQAMWKALEEHCHWEGEIWDRRADGTLYLKYLAIERVTDRDGKTTNYLAMFNDLSEQKRTEEEVERLTYYDALTALPNRILFRNRLEHEFNVSSRHDSRTGLILLNLDRFKQINDTFGFSAGDALLKEIAERFGTAVRRTDLVARQEKRPERDPDLISRMGSDDFSFILSEMRRPEDASVVAERLMHTLEAPFHIKGEEVYVSASMGISVFPDNASDQDGLLHCAESALAEVKAAGRGGYRFFSEDMNITSADRVRLEAQLRRAVADKAFCLYYQPKLDLLSGAVTGLEALIRWPHPDGRMVPPIDFIPLAEDTGLIKPLGEWILHQAFTDTKIMIEKTGQPLQVAVNLSARQFQQADLCRIVRSALEATGLSPAHVELEITESMVMKDAEEAIATMRTLRELGLTLAIDDFGTGYSSLAYLRNFPVNTLKIDKGFTSDLETSTDNACIINAVVGLGRGLGLTVVAEGVETEQQMNRLRTVGCHTVQGYYIARPAPLDTVIPWLIQQESTRFYEPGTST